VISTLDLSKAFGYKTKNCSESRKAHPSSRKVDSRHGSRWSIKIRNRRISCKRRLTGQKKSAGSKSRNVNSSHHDICRKLERSLDHRQTLRYSSTYTSTYAYGCHVHILSNVEIELQKLSHKKLDIYQRSIEFLAIAIQLLEPFPKGHGTIVDQLK